MALSFLKKGKDAHDTVEAAHQQQEIAKEQRSIRRYYLPIGADGKITFLDGDLTEEGLVDTTSYKEHQLYRNGNYFNFYVCTYENEPCPLCALPGKDGYSSIISLFTVIDHSEYTDKQGNHHQNERRLFACKRDTLLRLQKYAEKRGGLEGCTFEVSRIGDKSPNVGSDFDFEEKRSLSEIKDLYGLDDEGVSPYDYEKVVHYRTAEELVATGVVGQGTIVGQADVKAQTTQGDISKYKDVL